MYTADVKLGHLRMMKKAVQKEPPNIPGLLNVQLRDRENPNECIQPIFRSRKSRWGKGKTPIDMSLNIHFKNYFGVLSE